MAVTLKQMATDKLQGRSAEQFIHELAHQAIMRDDSMMSREIGYWGFGTAPILSDSLFSDPFIVVTYNPLEPFGTISGDAITASLLKRFNSAVERCYTTLIEEHHTQYAQVAFSIQSFYRTTFMQAYKFQQGSGYDHTVTFEMWEAVRLAAKMANKLLASLNQSQYDSLFVSNAEIRRHDVLETLVEIVYEAMTGVSNEFKGVGDPFWSLTMDVIHDIFHSIGAEPDGMTPFQQRLALKIVHKLNDNMKGFYPAISRALLSTVGPYEHDAPQSNKTAFNILKDAAYISLRSLPKLAQEKPDKVGDYLPPNVTYEVATNRLIHTYSDGAQRVTDLSALHIHPFSLTNPQFRRGLTDEERRAAENEF